jgi:anthranilate synthase component 1
VATREGDETDPLSLVAGELARCRTAPVSGLPDFCGGAVGYLGYEAARRFERLPSPDGDPLGLPEAVFMFVDTILVFDHVTRTIKLVSLARPDGDAGPAAGRDGG